MSWLDPLRSNEKVAILADRFYVNDLYFRDEIAPLFERKVALGKLDNEILYEQINHWERFNLDRDTCIVAINRGLWFDIIRCFPDFKILDYRVKTAMQNPLRIKMPPGARWRGYQPGAIETLVENDVGLLKAPPRAGKPVWVKNEIQMGDGSYKKLEDICVGDCVLTHEGRSRKVLEIFEQPQRPTLCLKTRSGITTLTALDHPYLTPEGFVEAKNLREGQHLIHRTFDLPESSRRDEEFLLAGFFTGDGSTRNNHAVISTKDPLRIQSILKCCDALGFKASVYEGNQSRVPAINLSGGVRDWLRASQLEDKKADTKFVPDWVFKASNRQIGLFLSAYFSCDGTVSSRGKTKNGERRSDTYIELYSVSLPLLRGCQKLFDRIGIRTSLRAKKGKYKNQAHQSWRLAFYEQDDVIKFRDLAHTCGDKTVKLKAIQGFRTHPDNNYWADEVLEIREAGTADCRCLTVEEDHTFISDSFVVHNTVILTGAICMDGLKTLLLAHQTDLLMQAYETFEKYTNLREIRTESNPIVGFIDEWEDLEKLDVVLCTKQTFDAHINQQYLPMVQRMFGAVRVDESHLVGADIYSHMVNRFWAQKRQGVTATPKRKDGRHVISEGVLGPVIYEVDPKLVNLAPLVVKRIDTGIKLKIKTYGKILEKFEESEQRNGLILQHMVEDVKAGRMILACTDRTKQGLWFSKKLTELGIPNAFFNGKINTRKRRKAMLDEARHGETKVLIIMRNMTTGLDIPRADMFYNMMPSSNVFEGEEGSKEGQGEGGYEQQCTRVRTEYPGKSCAWVKDFVDDIGTCYAMWKQRVKCYDKIGARIEYNGETVQNDPFAWMMGGEDAGWGK